MKKNINIKITPEMFDFLVEEAKQLETTVSHAIRIIIKKYIDNSKASDRI